MILEDFYRANLIPLPTLIMDEVASSEFLTEACEKQVLDVQLAQQAFGNLTALLPNSPYTGTASVIGRLSVMRSELITTLLDAFEISAKGDIIIQPQGKTLAEILKYLTRKYVIEAPNLSSQRYGHRRIITDLFNAYCDIGPEGESTTPASRYPVLQPQDIRGLSLSASYGRLHSEPHGRSGSQAVQANHRTVSRLDPPARGLTVTCCPVTSTDG